MRFDATLEGTEAEKNAALAPALPVPQIDREVMHAQGKAVGLLNDRPADPSEAEATPADADMNPRPVGAVQTEPEATVRPLTSRHERRPTQDELMGYHDDEPDFDDEPF